ncbi:MAG: beta-propeller domain-containing protein [Patescibacteria group bacterium]
MDKKRTIIILVVIMVLALGGYLGFKLLKPESEQPSGQLTNNVGNFTGGSDWSSGTVEQQLANQSQIKRFGSLEELQNFLESNSGSSYGYSSYGMMKSLAVETGLAVDSLALGAPQAVADGRGGGGSDDYSRTNIQVAGVDEADIIKTDGKYIYVVVQNDLYVVDAYPANQASVLTKISFKSRPTDVYINGDNLVIFGADDQIYNTDIYKRFRRHNPYTFFKVFDISDPKDPKQIRDLDFEGSYSNSRMVGDYVYFVTNNYNYGYIEDEPVLPRIIDNGEVVANSCTAGVKCFAPDIYYFDLPYNYYNFTTVTAINVKNNNQAVNGDVYLLAGNQNMYVSQNNIYITYTKYISEYQLEMEVMKEMIYPRLSQKDRDRIDQIEKTDSFILNRDEKMNKIAMIIEHYGQSLTDEEQTQLQQDLEAKMKQKYQDISKELEKTVIHKIAINQDKLEYKTFGEVTGDVLNQFSMDENNGYFRIATTKNQTWSRYYENDEEQQKSYNNLYVLDENLKVVGSLESLAQDERIYSVRFMQNRAYLVTFKQVDPLFVIDLSVPTNPKVLGKLKVPGFSNYLHPYDDTHLIGFGKDTGETEWGGVRTKGLKLSLFDVSDVANPKEVDTYVMGDSGSDSIALYDHKAFLFSKDKNLLVVPVSIRETVGENRWGKLTFSGAAVFKVDLNGIELKGKIDHSNGGQSSNEDYWNGVSYYDNSVKRALYISDTLYTFSNQYLKMNKLDNLDLVKNLELKKNKTGSSDDFEVIN